MMKIAPTMSKEEEAILLDRLVRNIEDFKVRCNIPFGDYTPTEQKDIEECIEKCAVKFYNLGIQAERQALMNEMHKIQERQNLESFRDMLEYGITIMKEENIPFKDILEKYGKELKQSTK